MPRIDKYNIKWPDGWSHLDIEFEAIRRGGKWTIGGQECGLGLFEHLMSARRLLWPRRYRHKWTDLLYQNFIENDITIMMGSASSQKTSHAAEYVLINYWARPFDTLAMLTTTTIDKLETGIFGEVKMLFSEARDLHPHLAGNLIDHKHAIVTDDIDEDVRDMRKGVCGKPCFPTGTMIDTPTGQRTIESLSVGDVVINACGTGIIKETHSTIAKTLVKIELSDGRKIDCTPDHPILTDRGWINAVDLRTYDMVFSADETMRMLRWPYGSGVSESETLLCGVSGPRTSKEVRLLREHVSPVETTESEVLQQGVRGKMGVRAHESVPCDKEVPTLRKGFGEYALPKRILPRMPHEASAYAVSEMRKAVHFEAGSQDAQALNFLQSVLLCEMEGEKTTQTTKYADRCGVDCLEFIPESVSVELPNQVRLQNRRKEELVQSRHCISRTEVGGRIGRRGSSHSGCNGEGQETPETIRAAWVVRVTVLEQAGDKRYRESEGGYRVHNLEVTGHPSYSVNRVIVHNCYQGRQWVGLGVFAGTKQSHIFFVADELQFMEATFLKAWPNMFSNGSLKIIGSGNPQHNPDDCLGIAAEPKDGWNSLPEPDVATVWPTRFLNGKCVNLVGTDSPNFVVKTGDPEPFPKLIGPRFAARIEHDYGMNSPEFYTQVKGVMKLSLAHSRVITREFCRQHHASDKCIWRGGGLVRVLAVDPAYGGGDRCVSLALEFGPGLLPEPTQIGAVARNQMFIRVVGYRTIPINAKRTDITPEDQIAMGVADDLERHNIPAQNCFYDSFGKGTVGFAFARKFGANSPIPVDAGSKPSTRPVRQDLYVWDESKHQKRLKRCDEEYGKKITELWMTWRQAIESEQVRELPEEIILEGTMREYYTVAGNKKDVEPKADLRERLGRSPDLADCFCIGLEGARQRGFVIERLGVAESDVDGLEWLSEKVRSHEHLIRSKQLSLR